VTAPFTRARVEAGLVSAGVTCRSLERAAGWLLAAPSLGARVMGLGAGEENALWTAADPAAGEWNAGGQRTWLGPEAGPRGFFFRGGGEWAVPAALDPGSYREAPADGWDLCFASRARLAAADGEGFDLTIRRLLALEECSAPAGARAVRLRFRHELMNAGESPIPPRIGLWSIIQCPAARRGTIIIPVVPGPGEPLRPYFTDLPRKRVRSEDGIVCLESLGGVKYKAGVPALRAGEDVGQGRIAHVRPARSGTGWIVVAARFAVDARGVYVDKPAHDGPDGSGNGDPIQAYNSPETGARAFAEIECHAPASGLAPGQSCGHDISITAAECGTDAALAALLTREISPACTPAMLFRE
jgi:hypothetical protein